MIITFEYGPDGLVFLVNTKKWIRFAFKKSIIPVNIAQFNPILDKYDH